MAAASYERSPTEIRTKINNLKSWYRRQTDRAGKPGRSGGARQKRSAIFEKLDQYLSDRPMTRPIAVVDPGAQADSEADDSDADSEAEGGGDGAQDQVEDQQTAGVDGDGKFEIQNLINSDNLFSRLLNSIHVILSVFFYFALEDGLASRPPTLYTAVQPTRDTSCLARS